MNNSWKDIWEKRSFDYDVLKKNDIYETFASLKRSDGFDVIQGGLSIDALVEQYDKTIQMLSLKHDISSVYEVGCGAGANLLLMENDGIACGGIDYSNALITIAERVLKTKDLLCGEALRTPREPEYDAALSNSVFSYFPDMDYAEKVLDIMCSKARFAVGIIDVHDLEKQSAYTEFRKAEIEDYEERYRDLPKLFYPKSFFEDFAAKHQLELVITDSRVKGYWNNDFVYNCFFYKK